MGVFMSGGNNSTGSVLLKIDRARPKKTTGDLQLDIGKMGRRKSFGDLMLDADRAMQERKADIMAAAMKEALDALSSQYGSRLEHRLRAMEILRGALKQADETGKP